MNRVLCLGNTLLADDALGPAVAEHLRALPLENAEVVDSEEAGFALLDMLIGCSQLIVVDTVMTGAAKPGTIHPYSELDLRLAPGNSPHYVGLFEALALARKLRLDVPDEVTILAVEAADCLHVGGEMHPAVRAAIPALISMIRERIPLEGSIPPLGEANKVTR